MFIPVRTDRLNKTVPWVNYALIGANVLVFLGIGEAQHAPAFFLYAHEPQLYQFISYQFLHANWMHLVGNMLFLWVFGNSVEDRLGPVGYLFFYLAAGVVAGLAHIAPPDAQPVIGASGAVAGVTGAYLALFPLSNVTLIFIFGGEFEVSSLALILFRIAQDAIFQLLGVGGVAYTAHLAGYAMGFAVGMALLVTRLVPREPYDMLALWQHTRRRRQFRKMAREGYHAWEGAKPTEPAGPAAPLTPEQERLMERRSRINDALLRQDAPEAARLYADLLRDHPDQVMAQQQQLDLANQLMGEGRYDTAAAAYELLLSRYPAYPQRHQVQLILGLIYARYLDHRARARQLLQEALPRLAGSDAKLARQTLDQLR